MNFEKLLHMEIWPSVKLGQDFFILFGANQIADHYFHHMMSHYRFRHRLLMPPTIMYDRANLTFLTITHMQQIKGRFRGMRQRAKVVIHHSINTYLSQRDMEEVAYIVDSVNGRAKPNGQIHK